MTSVLALLLAGVVGAVSLSACGGAPRAGKSGGKPSPVSVGKGIGEVGGPDASGSPSASPAPAPPPAAPLPRAGNPAGGAGIPADGQPVDTSHQTRTVGNGTPASCTSAAV